MPLLPLFDISQLSLTKKFSDTLRGQNDQKSIQGCLCSSQIFHAIPSSTFSALWNSARSSNLTPRYSPAILTTAGCTLSCSDSPRARLRRVPSRKTSLRRNDVWGFQGGMPLWSQDALWNPRRGGREREEASERWKGESEAVPPPKGFGKAKSSDVASSIPEWFNE
jgi:hypothetical protein